MRNTNVDYFLLPGLEILWSGPTYEPGIGLEEHTREARLGTRQVAGRSWSCRRASCSSSSGSFPGTEPRNSTCVFLISFNPQNPERSFLLLKISISQMNKQLHGLSKAKRSPRPALALALPRRHALARPRACCHP